MLDKRKVKNLFDCPLMRLYQEIKSSRWIFWGLDSLRVFIKREINWVELVNNRKIKSSELLRNNGLITFFYVSANFSR